MVTAVAINREVKARGSPMRGGYSASINAESDFTLNFHMLAKLKKELKKKMNLKTDSNHKESTLREIKEHEEQIAELIGSLINHVNPFHGATRNMTSDVEILSNIANGLL